MTTVVLGNTLLLLWLNCAAPAQTIDCSHLIKQRCNGNYFMGDIKVPAGMKMLTCSFSNIHQRHEDVL